MLTKWLAFIELVKQLVENRSKTDRQYVDDFLDPLWYAFLRIHEDYKDSFARYLSIISPTSLADNEAADKLLTQVREDSEGSQDIRSELQSILKHMPSLGQGARDQKIRHLGQAIFKYFQIDNEYRIRSNFHLLNLHSGFLIMLERPIEANLNDENIEFINVISKPFEEDLRSATEHIHKAYSSVADAFHDLRSELLRKK